MKIALAQIDMRLGDIEGICARVESQAVLAHEQGARILCVPTPLISGLVPGSLIDESNFEHELLTNLIELSHHLEPIDVIALVPAVVSYEGAPLFEVFMLKEGRVVPVRTLLARRRGGGFDELWVPPVFDVDGVRIAVTFDVLRDLQILPPGCDLVLFFQANAYEVDNEVSAAVAAVADGYYAREVAAKGVWMACMAPVGGYDEVAFTGGSFVMDDAGRVVSAAPCFEEALLVQDIQRGTVQPALETHELPQYQRELWLWEALRLHLRDSVRAFGATRAALVLEGDLPSSLTASLAVDALGPRNVIGLLIERTGMLTPRQEAAEHARCDRVRELARGLGIQLVERTMPDASLVLDRDTPASDAARIDLRVGGLLLEDVATEHDACPVSSITKTDAALAAPAIAPAETGVVAPFGDVYLTALEFVARMRARAGSAIPTSLITLNAVEDRMAVIVARAVATCPGLGAYRAHAMELLGSLEPSQIDGALEAHVDHGGSLDEAPLSPGYREAVALLLMMTRAGEAWRRRLPLAPIVSPKSFAERAWPETLAWSDTGHAGDDLLTCADLADQEMERFQAKGEEYGERVRSEILSVIASLLGIPLDQLTGSDLGEELMNRMRRDADRNAGEHDGPIRHGMPSDEPDSFGGMMPPGSHPHGFSYFSQN